jgi:hypothetical protein
MNSEVKCNDTELDSNQWTNLLPTKRRVHFVATVQVRETITVWDYTPEEVQHSWYSKREFKQAKQAIRI